MTAANALNPQNQVRSPRMGDIEAGGANVGARPAVAGERGLSLVAVISVSVAIAAAVLAMLVSRSSDPLLLTLLAVLAMLGVFFLLAAAAGHVRLGERITEGDLLRATVEAFDDGVMVASSKGGTVYWNAAFERLVGRPEGRTETVIERTFIGAPAASEALFRLARSAERREPRLETLTLPDNDARGTGQRTLRVAVSPFSVPGHRKALGGLVLWHVTDVTGEHVRAAETISSLEMARAYCDAMPVGLLALSADGSIRHINRTLLEWLGMELTAGTASLKVSDVMAADARLLTGLASADAEAGPRPKAIVDLIRKSGERVPASIVCRVPGGSEGLLFVAVQTRIDAAPAEAEEGRSGETRFSRLFQSAPFGIATLGSDGRIIGANAAFGRLLLTGGSSTGEQASDVLCSSAEPETRQSVEGSLKLALAGRAGQQPAEIAIGPNREFTRRVFMSPLGHSKKAREAAVLYVIDATEQKALELRFAQSQKMEAVGNLAGGIAHDFNNVLTAIIGFSDLLLQTHRQTDPAYKDIMNIKSSANRAASLVQKLLAYSRRQTLQTEALRLDEVLTDLAALLKRSIGEKIQLKLVSGRDLWSVKTDKTQLEQVVLNLAVNARDAMLPEGGVLTIRTKNISERESQKLGHHGMALGEYVLLEVEDTGIGMTPDIMKHIFEPYFTTKGVGKGTGLGLAGAYGLVKQTGGYIFPESEPGKGTTFRVYLPRVQADAEDAALPKATRKERKGDLTGSGRVLLVEDEDIVRSFAVRALKRQGYEVLEASTGIEALEVMAKNVGRVDIVVSDVVMPEMDGPTLLKELRKKNPEMKIIFMSGYPNEAFRNSLDENEQFAFLPKPFSLPQLAAKVKEQLGR